MAQKISKAKKIHLTKVEANKIYELRQAINIAKANCITGYFYSSPNS